jgi:hypothetical protein
VAEEPASTGLALPAIAAVLVEGVAVEGAAVEGAWEGWQLASGRTAAIAAVVRRSRRGGMRWSG